jgi:hypothetical protein
MTAINYAELALIQLEYSAADHLARQSATSDPLERADLSLRVRTILTAITALGLALDVMQVSSDPETGGLLVSLASEPSAKPAARPVLYAIKSGARRQ